MKKAVKGIGNPLLMAQMAKKITSGGVVPKIIGGVIAAGAIGITGWYLKKQYDNRRRSDTNKMVGSDPHVNIAAKIHAENRASFTVGSRQVEYFKEIKDFDQVKAAYAKLSTGEKDIIEDTRKGVSSGNMTTILNILGVSSGAIKATSQQALSYDPTKVNMVIAKRNVNLRKGPQAKSDYFNAFDLIPAVAAYSTFQYLTNNNIITTIKAGQTVGSVVPKMMKNNGGKFFHDPKTNTWFVPVLVRDSANLSVGHLAFVALSQVDIVQVKNLDAFTDQLKKNPLARISKSDYDGAKATVSGISLNGINDIAKLLT